MKKKYMRPMLVGQNLNNGGWISTWLVSRGVFIKAGPVKIYFITSCLVQR